jgi:FkbM family methyltransferase
MFGLLKRRPPPPSPPPEPAPPARSPVEEIAYRHGEVYGAQASLVVIDGALTIIDGGMHHGQSAEKYLLAFPACRVVGFEPAPANFDSSRTRLEPFAARMTMFPHGLSDHEGAAQLNINSHDGTHSLLEIGDLAHWDSPATTLDRRPIGTVTLDGFCREHSVDHIDILKLDIQGMELSALRGAEGLLRRRAIGLVAAEVNFLPIYRDMPLFWDVAAYMLSLGYALHGLFDLHHALDGSGALRWADAIFVAPR